MSAHGFSLTGIGPELGAFRKGVKIVEVLRDIDCTIDTPVVDRLQFIRKISGRFKNSPCRLQVERYPKTAEVKVTLIPVTGAPCLYLHKTWVRVCRSTRRF